MRACARTHANKMDLQSHKLYTESQIPVLHSSTQPQTHKSRGLCNKVVTDTKGHMPQIKHADLGSQTCPTYHDQSHMILDRATL